MAFLQFPQIQYFRVFRESENTVKGGSFTLSETMDLKHCIITPYIEGALVGNEQIRMEIYPTDASTTAIYTSEWASLSGVGTYSPNWIGNIYLDFTTAKPLNPNITYFFRFKIQNYTYVDGGLSVSLNLDWTDRVNDTPAADEAGVRIRLIGYKNAN